MSDSPSQRRLKKYVEQKQKPPTGLITRAWLVVLVGGVSVGMGAMTTSSISGYVYPLYNFGMVFLWMGVLCAFIAMVMGFIASKASKGGAGGLLAALAALGLMAVAGFLLFHNIF